MERQAETVTIVTDGACSGMQNEKMAAEKIYDLPPQILQGRKPNTYMNTFLLLTSVQQMNFCVNGKAFASSMLILGRSVCNHTISARHRKYPHKNLDSIQNCHQST